MSESQYALNYIAIFLISILFLTILILGPWYYKFRKTSKRIDNTINEDSSIIAVYRARYGNNYLMGELYLYKNEIRFEKAGKNNFSLTPNNISKVIYNKRSLQLIDKSGAIHNLRYLHPSVKKEGLLGYDAMYGVMYHDPETLKEFLNNLNRLGIATEEGSTGRESRYFYIELTSAVLFVGTIITLLVAKFVLGMETFLGIKL